MSYLFQLIFILFISSAFSQELPLDPSLVMSPGDVAIDADDNIYVVDCDAHFIFKIYPDGKATIIGGSPHHSGYKNGSSSDSLFYSPCAIGVDSQKNIIVGDNGNGLIRKITKSTLSVSTIAGLKGQFGYRDGPASEAKFNGIWGLALDKFDNIYVAEAFNHDIRKIDALKNVSTVGGISLQSGSEDGLIGHGMLHSPNGIVIDKKNGNMYTADLSSSLIKYISPEGSITTIMGIPYQHIDQDGPRGKGSFVYPIGISLDKNLNLYIADFNAQVIKIINNKGILTTIAGESGKVGFRDGPANKALFCHPSSVAVDSQGNVIVTDTFNHLVRKISTKGYVSTIFGNPPTSVDACIESRKKSNFFKELQNRVLNSPSNENYPAPIQAQSKPIQNQTKTPEVQNQFSATFFALDKNNNIYTTTQGLHALKKISADRIETPVAGDSVISGSNDAKAIQAKFKSPSGIVIDQQGNIFVADSGNNTIRKINNNQEVTTIAGHSGESGIRDGANTSAKFNLPTAMTIDRHDNIYLTDTNNHTIRKISPNGEVSTFAGLPGEAGSSNNKRTESRFYKPSGIAIDSNSNFYISDTGNNIIRKISSNGSTSTFAGTASDGEFVNSDLINSKFNKPTGLAVDQNDNLYVADSANHIIRKISPLGKIEVFAGIPNEPGNNDGQALKARLNNPTSIAIDNFGNIYIADNGNSRIRLIRPNGVMTTISSPSNSPLSR